MQSQTDDTSNIKSSDTEIDENNSKDYKVKAILDSAVYASKSKGHLLGLYYLVSRKVYPKEKNT